MQMLMCCMYDCRMVLSHAIQATCAKLQMLMCCMYDCRMVLSHAIHATCAKLQMLMCCMYDCRMALSDAKGDVDDRVRDLAASERELEKADFDLRYKTHEAKLVNKAAVAKRTEVGEVHNFCHAAVCHACCAAVCHACSSAAADCQLPLKTFRESEQPLDCCHMLCVLQHSMWL